jgi:hypothetical protein
MMMSFFGLKFMIATFQSIELTYRMNYAYNCKNCFLRNIYDHENIGTNHYFDDHLCINAQRSKCRAAMAVWSQRKLC